MILIFDNKIAVLTGSTSVLAPAGARHGAGGAGRLGVDDRRGRLRVPPGGGPAERELGLDELAGGWVQCLHRACGGARDDAPISSSPVIFMMSSLLPERGPALPW